MINELNFEKNQNYSNKDPNDHIIDLTSFSYYCLTTSINYIIKTVRKQTTPIFRSFIQGTFDNLEQLLNNLKHEFDITALIDPWHTVGNQNFIFHLLTGYQNYEGKSGSTLKRGCGFYKFSNLMRHSGLK